MYSGDTKLAAVQRATLRIAEEISAFCTDNNIICYLCGGGAIGAIREGGFVPWDDDLDFFMPRADYERFCSLWREKGPKRYVLERPAKGFVNHNNFTTIRDSETTFVKTYQADLDVVHGIAVDVFPLDVAPTAESAQRVQKLWAMIYALFSEQVVPATHGALMKCGSKILFGLFRSQNIRYRIWRFAERRMTAYDQRSTGLVTELCVGPRYMGNCYDQRWFASAELVPFEDTQLPVPIGYDAYLTQVFGNYHERPALAQQQPHHDAVFIDPETPYAEYRGKYYLTNK